MEGGENPEEGDQEDCGALPVSALQRPSYSQHWVEGVTADCQALP